MQYFEELTSKYGFNDGEAVPDGIIAYRSVYIEAINALAEAFESEYRAISYNRLGVHNPYLIMFAKKADLDLVGVPAEWYDIQNGHNLPEPVQEAYHKLFTEQLTNSVHDNKMQWALDAADSCSLDDMLVVKVTKNTVAMATFLDDIKNRRTPKNYYHEYNEPLFNVADTDTAGEEEA